MEVLTDVLFWTTIPLLFPVVFWWNLDFDDDAVIVVLCPFACFSFCLLRAAARLSTCCVARRLAVETMSGVANFSSC